MWPEEERTGYSDEEFREEFASTHDERQEAMDQRLFLRGQEQEKETERLLATTPKGQRVSTMNAANKWIGRMTRGRKGDSMLVRSMSHGCELNEA